MESLATPWGELATYLRYASEGSLEYPPLAIKLFQLANAFGEQWFTITWYGLVALVIVLICLTIQKMKGNFYIFLASIMPLGGLLWDRFDIFPAMLTVAAVYLATISWGFLALPILGIAVALKVYPILLLPVLMGMLWKRKEYHDLLLGLFLFAVIVWFGLGSAKSVWQFHGKRGIHLESVRAIPLILKSGSITEFKHNTFEIK